MVSGERSSGERSRDNLVWIDLEMTGLDPRSCVIVEIATLITDAQLNLVAEGPSLVIHQPRERLEQMSEFVEKMHTRSGLLERIASSELSLAQAEAQTLDFIRQHCAPQSAPLCGNSIWKDRQFLETFMPELSAYVHYRNVDVSTIKELCKRWHPSLLSPPKKEAHRALDDIRESINELRWYRDKLFPPAPPPKPAP